VYSLTAGESFDWGTFIKTQVVGAVAGSTGAYAASSVASNFGATASTVFNIAGLLGSITVGAGAGAVSAAASSVTQQVLDMADGVLISLTSILLPAMVLLLVLYLEVYHVKCLYLLVPRTLQKRLRGQSYRLLYLWSRNILQVLLLVEGQL